HKRAVARRERRAGGVARLRTELRRRRAMARLDPSGNTRLARRCWARREQDDQHPTPPSNAFQALPLLESSKGAGGCLSRDARAAHAVVVLVRLRRSRSTQGDDADATVVPFERSEARLVPLRSGLGHASCATPRPLPACA